MIKIKELYSSVGINENQSGRAKRILIKIPHTVLASQTFFWLEIFHKLTAFQWRVNEIYASDLAALKKLKNWSRSDFKALSKQCK